MRGSSGDTPPAATDPLDRHRFPCEEWRFVEKAYGGKDLGITETLFAIGNGYLGMRGNVEEGRETHTHGTFINGFHEVWPIRHAEEAFGFARVGQTIVNIPDNKTIKLYVDDEPLLLAVADLVSYERALDFRNGVLTRDILWRTPGGKNVHVRSSRMVSFPQRHLAIMTFEVTMVDQAAPVVISSQTLNRQDGRDEYHVKAAAMGAGVDPRKAETFEERVLDPQVSRTEDGRLSLSQLEDDTGGRSRSRDRDRVLLHRAHQRRRGHRQDGVPGRCRAGADDQGHQGGLVPQLARGARPRARRPLPSHPGAGQAAGRRPAVRRPAAVAR
jgi:alpha,alpha-trehalose phosphorylase